MSRIEWSAVRAGALVGIAICLPLAIVAEVLAGGDENDEPAASLVLYVAVLVGLVVAGHVAARRAVDTPFASGGVAALVAFVAIQAIGVITNAVRGDSIGIVNIVFNGMLAYGCGLLGASTFVRRQPPA